MRGKGKQQLKDIVSEHKALKDKNSNVYGLGYEKNKKFYEKVLKVLLSGGSWEDTIYHTDARFDAKIKKLEKNFQPRNAAKSEKIVPLIDPHKLKSKAHQYKQKKYLKDLQHKLLMDMREELTGRITFIKEKQEQAMKLLKRKQMLRDKYLGKGDKFKTIVDIVMDNKKEDDEEEDENLKLELQMAKMALKKKKLANKEDGDDLQDIEVKSIKFEEQELSSSESEEITPPVVETVQLFKNSSISQSVDLQASETPNVKKKTVRRIVLRKKKGFFKKKIADPKQPIIQILVPKAKKLPLFIQKEQSIHSVSSESQDNLKIVDSGTNVSPKTFSFGKADLRSRNNQSPFNINRNNTPNLLQGSRLYYLKKEFDHKQRRISVRHSILKPQKDELIPGEDLVKYAQTTTRAGPRLSVFDPEKRFQSFQHKKIEPRSPKKHQDHDMLKMLKGVAGPSTQRKIFDTKKWQTSRYKGASAEERIDRRMSINFTNKRQSLKRGSKNIDLENIGSFVRRNSKVIMEHQSKNNLMKTIHETTHRRKKSLKIVIFPSKQIF